MANTMLGVEPSDENLVQLIDQRIEKAFSTKLQEKLDQIDAGKTPSMALVSTKGTLDWAYIPFILGSTAAALGWNVSVFFTFYGLLLLKKDIEAEVSPLGNPAMPMRMPFGPNWFRKIQWPIPNLLMASVPGFEKLATSMMKKTFKDKGVATVEELRAICVESGVKLFGCQMTIDTFGFNRDEFIPEVTDYVGAASFLPMAQKSDVCLFV